MSVPIGYDNPAKFDQTKKNILKAIPTKGKGVTLDKMAKKSGVDRATVGRVISRLVGARCIMDVTPHNAPRTKGKSTKLYLKRTEEERKRVIESQRAAESGGHRAFGGLGRPSHSSLRQNGRVVKPRW